jgi:TPR repeat protein
MYEAGDGVQQDLRLARYWYSIAAGNGDEAAPGKLKEIDAKLLGPAAAANLPATAPP